MAELYHVEATAKNNCVLTMFVYIVHQDESEFYTKKNFALQLIWPPANPFLEVDFPLGNAVPFESFIDPEWMNAHAGEFVSKVEILSTRSYPIPEGFDFSAPMANLERMPRAEYRVSVTASRWLDHIQPPQSWKSAAYDMGGK
jgi:hypothetical protein